MSLDVKKQAVSARTATARSLGAALRMPKVDALNDLLVHYGVVGTGVVRTGAGPVPHGPDVLLRPAPAGKSVAGVPDMSWEAGAPEAVEIAYLGVVIAATKLVLL